MIRLAVKALSGSDLVNYIITGDEFVIYKAMVTLRKKYNLDIMLNDGGRIMSNGVRSKRRTTRPFGKVVCHA
ncbi:MAG TPA: hypothetical protein VFI73_01950 [Candidatus Nitrosopolaris sp.]|nr:hypothetical protein [Candidatus Nitrosopolaris sp.]